MQHGIPFSTLTDLLGITTPKARMAFVLHTSNQGDLQAIKSLLAPFDIVFEDPYPITALPAIRKQAEVALGEVLWYPKGIPTGSATSPNPFTVWLKPSLVKVVNEMKQSSKGYIKWQRNLRDAKKMGSYHTLESITKALQAHRGLVTASTLGIV